MNTKSGKWALVGKDLASGLSGGQVLKRLNIGFYDHREWLVDGATFLMQPDGYDVSAEHKSKSVPFLFNRCYKPL